MTHYRPELCALELLLLKPAFKIVSFYEAVPLGPFVKFIFGIFYYCIEMRPGEAPEIVDIIKPCCESAALFSFFSI